VADGLFRLSETLYEFKKSAKNALNQIGHFATLGQNAILPNHYTKGFKHAMKCIRY
jgi:hypothetical protein